MLLGEADMSFARVLGLQGFSGVITATELEKPSHLAVRHFGSHSRLAERCNELARLGIRVALGVDGIRLERNEVCHHWSVVASEFIKAPLWRTDVPPVSRFVFNFPHTTRPGKMQKLLNQFFRSVRASIARGFARFTHGALQFVVGAVDGVQIRIKRPAGPNSKRPEVAHPSDRHGRTRRSSTLFNRNSYTN